MIRNSFDVDIHYPELVFLKKMNTYLIGYDNRHQGLVELIEALHHPLLPVHLYYGSIVT